jgi:hypothetical protein
MYSHQPFGTPSSHAAKHHINHVATIVWIAIISFLIGASIFLYLAEVSSTFCSLPSTGYNASGYYAHASL